MVEAGVALVHPMTMVLTVVLVVVVVIGVAVVLLDQELKGILVEVLGTVTMVVVGLILVAGVVQTQRVEIQQLERVNYSLLL